MTRQDICCREYIHYTWCYKRGEECLGTKAFTKYEIREYQKWYTYNIPEGTHLKLWHKVMQHDTCTVHATRNEFVGIDKKYESHAYYTTSEEYHEIV